MTGIQAIGWLGQGAYFGRSLLQWLASERQGRSVVPRGFWTLSVCGALALLGYAAWNRDPVILLGQAVNLTIYLRNLRLERRPAAAMGRTALLACAGLLALTLCGALLFSLARNHGAWTLVGWVGQFIFLTRFPLQWWTAEREGRAVLPPAFWWISLWGSLLILGYALSRADAVIATGQGVGLLTYGRNLALQRRGRELAAR
jgi:lipid-A-disaccharide synthase-like uncharacterized protein